MSDFETIERICEAFEAANYRVLNVRLSPDTIFGDYYTVTLIHVEGDGPMRVPIAMLVGRVTEAALGVKVKPSWQAI